MRSASDSGFDLREIVDEMRETFAPRPPRKRTAADLRTAVLRALLDESRTGASIIDAIAASSGGMGRPTPGEVYPLLQLLSDEALVEVAHDGDRRVYSLTDAGRVAAEADDGHEHEHGHDDVHGRDRGASTRGRWEERAERGSALPRAGVKLAQATAQVAQNGTREQRQRAVELLDETRRRLYAILAED
ncbi:helix-turn-helix transcriptional regulator [Microcella daejeonensis]|uniref:Helix-turn-helix transcriptional regulator n=1 Tax=Microcella daejeonensis TaxID=2994971 RepID=A0A9E8S7F6_9MICO|nr:helix-turn-helix transcriptional regulator [Microcella daejeonensis]WAB80420.1 helix-turn-helix transcriptional regulator [Microcella daejeonensis]